jgi:predicted secreted Zn-dependent protease
MHLVALACAATVLGAAFVGSARAETRVTVKRADYNISGATGEQLLAAMDRSGPRHGFMTRAIAQTRYKVGWDIDGQANDGACRVGKVDADLAITYMYPRVTGHMAPKLQGRWNRFMRGVRSHEETHGKIARQMVREAIGSVSKLASRDDRSCARTKRELKRRISAIYEKYEARQVAFDKKEHREGGNVDHLVARFLAKR